MTTAQQKLFPNQRKAILNCFRPGTAIDHPSQFAGRKDEIARLVDALHVDGSCPIIYGERGLGKSSLALQIERIALGDTELLEELSLHDRVFESEDAFVTFQFYTSDDIRTKDDLLQRLINTAEGFTDAQELPASIPEVKSTKSTIKLKVYEREVSRSYGSHQSFRNLNVEEKLALITGRIVEKMDRRVLFIIDELDRAQDTKGLASVIKNMSTSDVKFLLVGVGTNVSSLLHDHASIERLLVQVPVQPMRDDDCAEIIRKAISYLQRRGIEMRFGSGAISTTVDASGGFPWFVHTIGQEALSTTYESGQSEVNEGHVVEAIKTLGKKRFGQQFHDTYQMAVGDSPQREIVLRLFAKWRGFDISTSEIYPIAHELGVKNPSEHTGQLATRKYGSALIRPPYARSRVFRFRNAMFKQFVNLSQSIYVGVRDKVDDGWKAARSR